MDKHIENLDHLDRIVTLTSEEDLLHSVITLTETFRTGMLGSEIIHHIIVFVNQAFPSDLLVRILERQYHLVIMIQITAIILEMKVVHLEIILGLDTDLTFVIGVGPGAMLIWNMIGTEKERFVIERDIMRTESR